MDFSALVGHADMLPAGSPDVAQLRADAVPLLTQVDARENLHTEKVVPLAAGMWNALYRLEPAGIVVKLSANDNDFEVNFLRQAAALKLPVPHLFSNGRLEHASLAHVTYFLMSYVPNCVNAWHLINPANRVQPGVLVQLGHYLGQALAKMHSVHLGYITRFGVKVARWQDHLTDGFSPDWDNLAPHALFDAELLAIFRRILDRSGYLAFSDGTFVHTDLVLTNVLVDTESHELRAIIDPGGYAGMPMYDLAYAAMPWDYGFEFYEAIVDSYRQHADKFDPIQFYTSILVVAYRHDRFHTPAVRADIFSKILPHLDF